MDPIITSAGATVAVIPAPRLLDQVRDRIRVKHYSVRTETAYGDWIKRFILFFDKRHPRELSAAYVEKFLSYLAVERNVAASTQNQAKSALLFMYKEVLHIDLAWLASVMQAKAPKRLPLLLTRSEVDRILVQLRTPTNQLIGGYPSGSRACRNAPENARGGRRPGAAVPMFMDRSEPHWIRLDQGWISSRRAAADDTPPNDQA